VELVDGGAGDGRGVVERRELGREAGRDGEPVAGRGVLPGWLGEAGRRAALVGVHGRVGGGEQRVAGGAVARVDGDPERGAVAVGGADDRVRGAAGDPGGGLAVGVGEDQRELVAADPEGGVGAGAADRGDRRGGGAQGAVAGGVAAEVVDGLEAVEVEEDDGERAGGGEPAVDRLVELAVVEQAGERVAACAGVMLGEHEEGVERERRVLGEGGERRALAAGGAAGRLEVADRPAAGGERHRRPDGPVGPGAELQLRLEARDERVRLAVDRGHTGLHAAGGRDLGDGGDKT
jgi:hypothetical protein